MNRPLIKNRDEYFYRHFQLSIDMKQEDAWRQVESEFYEDNGRGLYTTYESFRKNKSIYYGVKSNRKL